MSLSFSQELNKTYFLISNDYPSLTSRKHKLVFKNDSLVNEIYQFQCGEKTNTYQYLKNNDSLTIFNFKSGYNRSYKFNNSEIINSNHKEVYLVSNKFTSKDATIFVINDSIWRERSHESKRKRNKRFKKFYKSNVNDPKKLKMRLLKAYDSYIKYGNVSGAYEYYYK